MDCSPPASSVHGNLQARIPEWVATPFSRGFSDPGMEPGSPALQADSLLPEPPGKPLTYTCTYIHEHVYQVWEEMDLSSSHKMLNS